MSLLHNTILWQAQNFRTSTVLIFLTGTAVDSLLRLRMLGLDVVKRRGVVTSVSEKPTPSISGVLTSTMKLEAASFLENLYPCFTLETKVTDFSETEVTIT